MTGPFSAALLAAVLVGLASASWGQDPFPYTLQWKRLTGNGVSLAWDDSLVFIGGLDGEVLAVDRKHGLKAWQYRGGGPVRQAPVVSGPWLVWGDAWSGVNLVERRTGIERWTERRLGWGDGKAVVQDSLIYLGSADGWVYALRLADGTQAWRLYTGLKTAIRPGLAAGRLYAGTGDGRLLQVDAGSGRRLASADLGGVLAVGPRLVAGHLLAATSSGWVRSYNAADLSPRWAVRLGGRPQTSLFHAKDHLVYAADGGWVYGIRSKDGRLDWSYDLGAKPLGAVLLQEGVLFSAADGGWVELAARDGAVRWEGQVLDGIGMTLVGEPDRLYGMAGDGYLYAFVPLDNPEKRSGTLWEDWWEVLDEGHKTGYVRQRADEVVVEGRRLLQVEEEAVQWRHGLRRVTSRVLVDRAFRPVSFAVRFIEGSQLVETRGIWGPGEIVVEQRLGSNRVKRAIAVERELVLPEVALLKLAAEGRIVGDGRDSLWVFDYEALEERLVFYQFGPLREKDGEVARLVRLNYAEPWLAEVEVRAWIDAEGREIDSVVEGLGTAHRRVDSIRARTWKPPGTSQAVYMDYVLADPARVDSLVLDLPSALGDPRPLLVEDERQTIRQDSAGRFQLAIRRLEYDGSGALELPVEDERLAPYLASSLYIQAEDERLVSLARRLRGPQRNAWAVAQRLQEWVYDHMIPKNTNVRFKSSLEVLEDMEGTCSEYTVLFAALCRAVGIPARVCVGFLASKTGALVLHIWTQVYVGKWIDMDPSWDEPLVDAAHIKTGQGLLTAAELGRLNMPLQLILSRVDTLFLVQYKTDEERVLAKAEEIYLAAEEADRHFEDERAHELYHRIVLLDWNRRSGPALMHIGRYHLRRQRFEEADWAFQRILTLDGRGDEADDALFYLARAAQDQDREDAAVDLLERILQERPDGDMADDALGRLGEIYHKRAGCAGALPYYRRLRREYGHSGWAQVAESALERCGGEGS